MIRVKFIQNWLDANACREEMKRYCKDNYQWNDIYLCGPDETPDFYVVINYPKEQIDLTKTVLFQWEPILTRQNWQDWNNPDSDQFLSNNATWKNHNIVTWYLSSDYNTLKDKQIVKRKIMSGVVSNGQVYDGHKDRYNFVKNYLDKLPFYEHYGRAPIQGLKSYKGKLDNKEDGLFPYKYTFAAENSYERNYFTEKIVDCILSECLAFYDGCPNIYDFFHKDALIKIDLKNPQRSIEIIQDTIKNNEWEQRWEIILKEKQRILEEFQVMPRLEKIIKNHQKGIDDNIVQKVSYIVSYHESKADVGQKRKRNLEILLDVLNDYFGESLEIIIIEQDTEPKLKLTKFRPNVKQLFVYHDTENNKTFNKAWSFNCAVKNTNRQIFCFGDTDIIMSKEDYYNAFASCHVNGIVDPFNKKMIDVVDDNLINALYNTKNVGYLMGNVRANCDSASGIFLLRKDMYEKIGGWDEGFEGWGCEDAVMEHKLRILNLPLTSLPHNAYHMNHNVAPVDQLQYSKNRGHLINIENMSSNQFTEYLSSRPSLGNPKKYTIVKPVISCLNKINLINFAHNGHYTAQKQCSKSAVTIGGVNSYYEYGWNDIDDNFKNKHIDIFSAPRGSGYWLWKPYFILKTLNFVNEGDIVLYADASAIFISSIQPLVDICMAEDTVIFGQKYLNRAFTKRDAFCYMNCDNDKYYNSQQVTASYMMFRKCKRSIELVNEYLNYCTDKRIISDDSNTCGLPNLPEFVSHRHDQSVISLLCEKEGIKLHRDPSQFGHEVQSIYPEDTYPQIINHNRRYVLAYVINKAGYTLNLDVDGQKYTFPFDLKNPGQVFYMPNFVYNKYKEFFILKGID
jgi:hypothetical protein